MARILDGATRTRAHAAIGKEPKHGAAQAADILTRHIEAEHPERLAEWISISASLEASRKMRNSIAHKFVEVASSIDEENIPLIIVRKAVSAPGQRVTLVELDALNAALRKDLEAALSLLGRLALKRA